MVDFLIVGQGLAGSLLAKTLVDRDKSVLIFDPNVDETSSKRAAGIYNPITGRKMVKTWLADDLFSGIEAFYHALEVELRASFLHTTKIYRPFLSIEEQNDWFGRSADSAYESFIENVNQKSIGLNDVIDPFGGLSLRLAGYVDVPVLLRALMKYFIDLGIYRNEVFQYDNLVAGKEDLIYKDYKIGRIVFCEGTGVSSNPFFNDLKFRPNKGELLNIEVSEGLNQILNRGVFMVPKGKYHQVGSTYENRDLNWHPSDAGRSNIIERLRKIFNGDFQLKDHFAGIRPATFDRRPYLGASRMSNRICIFNGLGTKGVSLAPFFSNKMADFLIDGITPPDSVRLYR